MITITNGAERMACKHVAEVLKHDPRRIVCLKCGKTTAVAK